MHKETCYELAKELGAFSRGFIELTPACKGGGTTAFCEEVAKHARRPVLFNAVIAFEHYPDIHKKQLRWLARCRERGLPIYGQGFTTDAGHTYSFEDWNLYDEMPAWREATTGSVAERLAKLSDPQRRPGAARLEAVPLGSVRGHRRGGRLQPRDTEVAGMADPRHRGAAGQASRRRAARPRLRRRVSRPSSSACRRRTRSMATGKS